MAVKKKGGKGKKEAYVIAGWLQKKVPAGKQFSETIQKIAREAGFVSYRVYLDGTEITPDDAPAKIPSGARIEITPDTKVG